MPRRVLVFLVIALGAALRADADGMLDPSFGNGGLVVTNFPGSQPIDLAYALVVLPDGRAVAAGKTGDLPGAMAAARYLPSGALDATFSGDGLVAVPPNCALSSVVEAAAHAVLLQPDGRLVLVGTCPKQAGSEFWLVRLNEDGSLDSSFGTGGQVFTPFPGGAEVTAGLLQPDGRVVAVGRGKPPGSPTSLVAARYNSDGSLDPTFGTAGQVILLSPRNSGSKMPRSNRTASWSWAGPTGRCSQRLRTSASSACCRTASPIPRSAGTAW